MFDLITQTYCNTWLFWAPTPSGIPVSSTPKSWWNDHWEFLSIELDGGWSNFPKDPSLVEVSGTMVVEFLAGCACQGMSNVAHPSFSISFAFRVVVCCCGTTVNKSKAEGSKGWNCWFTLEVLLFMDKVEAEKSNRSMTEGAGVVDWGAYGYGALKRSKPPNFSDSADVVVDWDWGAYGALNRSRPSNFPNSAEAVDVVPEGPGF